MQCFTIITHLSNLCITLQFMAFSYVLLSRSSIGRVHFCPAGSFWLFWWGQNIEMTLDLREDLPSSKLASFVAHTYCTTTLLTEQGIKQENLLFFHHIFWLRVSVAKLEFSFDFYASWVAHAL